MAKKKSKTSKSNPSVKAVDLKTGGKAKGK